MNISYLAILNTLESFASAHMEVKRFASDFPEQMPNFATQKETFPILFAALSNSAFSENANTFTMTIYSFDIIEKDRSNINTILSVTNRILNDVFLWYKEDNTYGIDIMEDFANVVPLNNDLLDYAAGHQMTITFTVNPYSVCEIPFNEAPVIVTEVCDIVYSQYLTCETLEDCPVITTIEETLVTLQEEIDNLPPGGNEDLAQTLAIGNTTGGSDIVVSAGDVIVDATGQIQIDFDNGNSFALTTDGDTFATGYLYAEPSYVQIGVQNGTVTVDSTIGAVVDSAVGVIMRVPGITDITLNDTGINIVHHDPTKGIILNASTLEYSSDNRAFTESYIYADETSAMIGYGNNSFVTRPNLIVAGAAPTMLGAQFININDNEIKAYHETTVILSAPILEWTSDIGGYTQSWIYGETAYMSLGYSNFIYSANAAGMFSGAEYIDISASAITLEHSTSIILTTPSITASALAGFGNRMVIADATGTLSTQTIPGGGDLATTLALGNTTGANDIVMSTNQRISSANGDAAIYLDNFGNAGRLFLATDGHGFGETYIDMRPTSLSIWALNGNATLGATGQITVSGDGGINMSVAADSIFMDGSVIAVSTADLQVNAPTTINDSLIVNKLINGFGGISVSNSDTGTTASGGIFLNSDSVFGGLFALSAANTIGFGAQYAGSLLLRAAAQVAVSSDDNILLYAPTLEVSSLTGTGTEMVVANATGVLSRQAIGDLSLYQLRSEKNQINGYAGLDGSGLINSAQLPAIAITNTFIVASQAAMLALSTAETGDIAIRTDINKTFILSGTYSVLADWKELLSPTDAVLSVFGRTGSVTAQSGDYTTAQVTESGNLYYTDARFDTRFALKSTSDLAEGTNLYYTVARFNTAFATKTTTDLTEGTNLYYTSARFDTAFAAKSTTNLTEGTNLYYTTARFDTAFGTKSTTNLTEGTNLYFTNTRAIAATLTGYTSGAGTITSSDTVLSAIQKLNGNIAAIDKEVMIKEVTFDGQGGVIANNSTATFIVPFTGTITGWSLFETSNTPVSSTCTIDAWKNTYTNYPPTVSDTIFGTKPSLSGAIKNQATGLSIAVTAGDIIKVNVDSNTNGLKLKIGFNLLRA